MRSLQSFLCYRKEFEFLDDLRSVWRFCRLFWQEEIIKNRLIDLIANCLLSQIVGSNRTSIPRADLVLYPHKQSTVKSLPCSAVTKSPSWKWMNITSDKNDKMSGFSYHAILRLDYHSYSLVPHYSWNCFGLMKIIRDKPKDIICLHSLVSEGVSFGFGPHDSGGINRQVTHVQILTPREPESSVHNVIMIPPG